MTHFTKLGTLIFALLFSVCGLALGQSLTGFTCSPNSIAVGASTSCTITISAGAPLAGFKVALSSSATGLTYPTTATVGWGSTTYTFPASTTASTPPQTATIKATAGAVSLSSTVTVTATAVYTITSMSCTPATLIPQQSAVCAAYLSATAPSGGLVASLTTSSGNLSIPSSVSIAQGASGFTFQTYVAKSATNVEAVTITGSLPAGSYSTSITIDPRPKFYLKGNGAELSLLANGASVYPSVNPAGWAGVLTVRGTGYLAFDPINGGGGIAVHPGGEQSANSAFINFAGAALGSVFDVSSEISFLLQSAYSFAERQALPSSNQRAAFEVFDNAGSWYVFDTYTASGQLQFQFGARGYSGIYTVPAGQEDVLFGKGVTAKIRITWTDSAVTLWINDQSAKAFGIQPKRPSWTSQSAFTIGSRSARVAAGGYYASDDSIAEFMIR